MSKGKDEFVIFNGRAAVSSALVCSCALELLLLGVLDSFGALASSSKLNKSSGGMSRLSSSTFFGGLVAPNPLRPRKWRREPTDNLFSR